MLNILKAKKSVATEMECYATYISADKDGNPVSTREGNHLQ